jgi:hypothetical protein
VGPISTIGLGPTSFLVMRNEPMIFLRELIISSTLGRAVGSQPTRVSTINPIQKGNKTNKKQKNPG